MAILTWDPWRDIEDMFGGYTKGGGHSRSGLPAIFNSGDWTPRVDIAETDKSFEIKAEIPEVDKDDVKVTVNKGILTIQGERKQEKEEKGKKFHRIERFYGSFTRSFTLPDNIDENSIKASFKEGVLKLKIKKTKPDKSKAKEIKIE